LETETRRKYCLLCAEGKAMLVGFPDRREFPWNHLNVPSRIDHLRNCHFIDADKNNPDKYLEEYFARNEQEIKDRLRKKFETNQQK